MTTYEVVSIILSALTFLVTSMIIIQIILAQKQKNDGHEEMRRVKTVDMMVEWCQAIKMETSFAEKIVENFSVEQCKKLFRQEPFEVDKSTKDEICSICSNFCNDDCKICKEANGKFTIQDQVLNELRWYVVSYINMLETLLLAWQMGIVDRDTIEIQFSFLFNPEMERNGLEAFRNAAGGRKNYPVTYEFCAKLEESMRPQSEEKKPLGQK